MPEKPHFSAAHNGEPRGEMVPNYSTIHAVNRVYNSLNTPGSKISQRDLVRVEKWIREGVNHKRIDDMIVLYQARARDRGKTTTPDRADALVDALDAIEAELHAATIPGIPGPSQEEMMGRYHGKEK